MSEYVCPVCKLRSPVNHQGDRHLTKCRHFGDNNIYLLHRVTEPVTRVTELVTQTITEPMPAPYRVTECEKCGFEGLHTPSACKQRRYRQRKAS